MSYSNVLDSLDFIAAPMVNQSDLAFRLLVREHGCTLAYTQMLLPQRLLDDREYHDLHLRDLQSGTTTNLGRPVVVQLAGNEPESLVQAAREVLPWADGIGEFASLLFGRFSG
jgi:tRNA-dihydrouridine synthase 1